MIDTSGLATKVRHIEGTVENSLLGKTLLSPFVSFSGARKLKYDINFLFMNGPAKWVRTELDDKDTTLPNLCPFPGGNLEVVCAGRAIE